MTWIVLINAVTVRHIYQILEIWYIYYVKTDVDCFYKP